MSHEVPASKCPKCGATNDRATNADAEESGPVPGSLTMCAYCAQLLVFDEEMRPRLPTLKELVGIPAVQMAWLKAVQARIRSMSLTPPPTVVALLFSLAALTGCADMITGPTIPDDFWVAGDGPCKKGALRTFDLDGTLLIEEPAVICDFGRLRDDD